MKIKKGDLVKVISGSKAKKGTVAKVVQVFAAENRLQIEGVAKFAKHVKPQKNPKHPEGGIIEGFASVHASNVMLMSESLGRPVRSGVLLLADGTKQRCVRGRNLKADVI